MIDQHALHERVLYEQIKKKVLDGGQSLESQGLLVPEPVSLTPAERTAVLEHQETLSQIGMEVDDFGGETIVIRSYPAMLQNKPPAEMFAHLDGIRARWRQQTGTHRIIEPFCYRRSPVKQPSKRVIRSLPKRSNRCWNKRICSTTRIIVRTDVRRRYFLADRS